MLLAAGLEPITASAPGAIAATLIILGVALGPLGAAQLFILGLLATGLLAMLAEHSLLIHNVSSFLDRLILLCLTSVETK